MKGKGRLPARVLLVGAGLTRCVVGGLLPLRMIHNLVAPGQLAITLLGTHSCPVTTASACLSPSCRLLQMPCLPSTSLACSACSATLEASGGGLLLAAAAQAGRAPARATSSVLWAWLVVVLCQQRRCLGLADLVLERGCGAQRHTVGGWYACGVCLHTGTCLEDREM